MPIGYKKIEVSSVTREGGTQAIVDLYKALEILTEKTSILASYVSLNPSDYNEFRKQISTGKDSFDCAVALAWWELLGPRQSDAVPSGKVKFDIP